MDFLRGWPVKEVETEKRRAAILRHLMNSTGNECGDAMLALACRVLGIVSTPQEIVAAIGWLESAGLVSSERFPNVVVAKITREGKAVARGHTAVAGVMTPTDFD